MTHLTNSNSNHPLRNSNRKGLVFHAPLNRRSNVFRLLEVEAAQSAKKFITECLHVDYVVKKPERCGRVTR